MTSAAILPDTNATSSEGKMRPKAFTAPASEWWQAIGFFLCMALVGLQFYPALLLVVMWLAYRFRTDRYAFLFEAMILFGGFGFVPMSKLPLKPTDVALALSVMVLLIMRRSKLTNRVLLLIGGYIAALLLIAYTSEESMRVQLLMMRNYFYILGFTLPLLTFANRRFEWERFMHTVFLHSLVICGLYVVDTFVVHGAMLIPLSSGWFHMGKLTFASIHEPYYNFTAFTYWPRHYPYALYWLVLCIVPLARKQVRLTWPQWALVLLTFYSTRTMSFIGALIVCFVCFRGNLKQSIQIGFVTLVALTGIYFVDAAIAPSPDKSPLRVASTVHQFVSLEAAADNEDLAEFGSGRMAQIIPKWELLNDLNRLWLGLGFLHPELTTNPKFQIKNEYYTDVSISDETATAVEVTQFQTVLDCGLLGLLIQTAAYIGLYFVLRRQKYSEYYLCTLVAMSVCGIGGFAGLIQRDGLLVLSTVLGAIILANPDGRSVEEHNLKSLDS